MTFVADPPPSDSVVVVHDLEQRLAGDRARRISLALGLLNDDLQLPGEFVGVDDRMLERVRLDLERRFE